MTTTRDVDLVLRLTVDPATRDLLVGALRQAADTRKRAATKAALEVARVKAAGNDPRAAAVRVVAVMAEAATLEAYADTLAALEPTPPAPPASPPAPATPTPRTRGTRKKTTAPKAEEAPPMPDLTPPTGDEPVDLDQLADDAGLTDTIIEESGREHGLDEDEPTADEVAGNVDTVAAGLTADPTP